MHTPHPTSRSLSQNVNLSNHRSNLSKKFLLISCSLAMLNICFVERSGVAQSPHGSDAASTTIARAPKVNKKSSTRSPLAMPAETARLCDLIARPQSYQNKLIRIDTMAVATAELSFLYDRQCAWPKPGVDLEFGSEEALIKVTPFDDFSRGKNSERRAYVTLIGRFEGPRADGYGHLGGFAFRFTASEVLSVERVPDSVPSSWPGPKKQSRRRTPYAFRHEATRNALGVEGSAGAFNPAELRAIACNEPLKGNVIHGIRREQAIAIASKHARAKYQSIYQFKIIPCELTTFWRVIFDRGGPEYVIDKDNGLIRRVQLIPENWSPSPSTSENITREQALEVAARDAAIPGVDLSTYSLFTVELEKVWRVFVEPKLYRLPGTRRLAIPHSSAPNYVIDKSNGSILRKQRYGAPELELKDSRQVLVVP